MIAVIVTVVWQVVLSGLFALFIATGCLWLLDVVLDRLDDRRRQR